MAAQDRSVRKLSIDLRHPDGQRNTSALCLDLRIAVSLYDSDKHQYERYRYADDLDHGFIQPSHGMVRGLDNHWGVALVASYWFRLVRAFRRTDHSPSPPILEADGNA